MFDSGYLASLGISADLAVYYVKANWLTRLSRGVFCRANDALDLYACLQFLQSRVSGLHVAGMSALSWHGLRQYVSPKPVVHLFGHESAKMPDWFVQRFPSVYRRKRLFDESPRSLMAVSTFGQQAFAPLVSEPERAFLEMLSEVGGKQALQEAREIAESAYALRSETLLVLLKACTNVKTIRICMQLGREVQLPWYTKIAPELQAHLSSSP